MPPRPADGATLDRHDGSVFGMSRDGATVTGLYRRRWVRRVLGVLDGTRTGSAAYSTGLSDNGRTVAGLAWRFFGPATKGFVTTGLRHSYAVRTLPAVR